MPRFSDAVIDHFTNPRNAGEIENADVRALVGNPVDGDQILLTALVHDSVVTEVRFRASGCKAALAVASMLTVAMRGATLEQIGRLDAAAVEGLATWLAPNQLHVANLGADAAARLVANFRRGVNDDDDPIGSASFS